MIDGGVEKIHVQIYLTFALHQMNNTRLSTTLQRNKHS